GQIMWNNCGMGRHKAGLEEAIGKIDSLREEFWQNVKVLGVGESFNQNLEHAGRLADFLEFGELLVRDALEREESCGGHFREEHQSAENEAQRNDDDFCHVAAWEFQGVGKTPTLHKEALEFEEVPLATRSYK
ncbi:MAG: fumarate reductase/succinate dehydrogenase flavoprotein subunit, partial [Fuerstiella sp.]